VLCAASIGKIRAAISAGATALYDILYVVTCIITPILLFILCVHAYGNVYYNTMQAVFHSFLNLK
jgi:hypothetical protein